MFQINRDVFSYNFKPSVALFWDHQNVDSKEVAVPILNFAKSKGNLIIAKVYDNWNNKLTIQNKLISISTEFECINVSENYPNAVDHKLEIDLTRGVAQIAPGWIILITGDNFAFSAIKTCLIYQKRVAIITERKKCAKHLDKIADELLFKDELITKFSPSKTFVN